MHMLLRGNPLETDMSLSALSALLRKIILLPARLSEPAKVNRASDYPPATPYFTKDHGIEKMNLCQECNMLDIHSMRVDEPMTHLSNIFTLLETSRYCRLCAMLAAHLMKTMGNHRLKSVLVSCDLVPSANISLRVLLQSNGLLQFSASWWISFEIATWSKYEVLAGGPSPEDSPIESDNVIRAALLANAPSCCINTGDGQILITTDDHQTTLPKRVIDLAAFNDAAKVQLRVTSIFERGRYATVSHRWGGDIPFKTTRRNLRRYTRWINVTELPQNFQDAIQIARMLSIRYIWIDALCIVQNDRADWREQAEQMGSIYEKSCISLALHSPTRSTDGFLWRMNVPKWLEISTEVAKRNRSSSFWLEMPSLEDGAVRMALGRSSITRRAWCLQELRLASRILHIVEDHCLWDCPHSESHMDGYDIFAGKSKAEATPMSAEDWLQLIEGYTSCDLTVAMDKIPAIAGVHSRWPNTWTAGSHCGLLGVDVHNGLLWLRSKSKVTLIRRPGRAPSWSWAGHDGEVRYLTLNYSDYEKFNLAPDAECVVFKCKCGDKAPTASHFTCVNCEILLHAVTGEGLTCGFPEKTKRFGQFCVQDPEKVETLRCPSLQLQIRDDRVGWALFDEFPVPEEFSYIRISSVSNKKKVIGYCLLLVLPVKGKYHRYRRVGMGYIFRLEVFEGIKRQRVSII